MTEVKTILSSHFQAMHNFINLCHDSPVAVPTSQTNISKHFSFLEGIELFDHVCCPVLSCNILFLRLCNENYTQNFKYARTIDLYNIQQLVTMRNPSSKLRNPLLRDTHFSPILASKHIPFPRAYVVCSNYVVFLLSG